MKKILGKFVLAAALGALACGALAQTADAPGPMPHAANPHTDWMQRMAAKHHARLKAKLKITAAQEGAWNAYLDSMKPMFHEGKRPDVHQDFEKLSAPEFMDKVMQIHKEREATMDAALESRTAAIKTFYAQLSPEQKTVFDREFAHMHHHGRHGWLHGWHSHHWQDQDQQNWHH